VKPYIGSLVAEPGGGLWIGFRRGGGLGYLKAGQFSRFQSIVKWDADYLSSDGHGSLWFKLGYDLFRMKEGRIERIDERLHVHLAGARQRRPVAGGREAQDARPVMHPDVAIGQFDDAVDVVEREPVPARQVDHPMRRGTTPCTKSASPTAPGTNLLAMIQAQTIAKARSARPIATEGQIPGHPARSRRIHPGGGVHRQRGSCGFASASPQRPVAKDRTRPNRDGRRRPSSHVSSQSAHLSPRAALRDSASSLRRWPERILA